MQVFKDSQLMDKKLTITDLDIIFSKARNMGCCKVLAAACSFIVVHRVKMHAQVKAKAARKISYDEFLTALPLVAEKKARTVLHA